MRLYQRSGRGGREILYLEARAGISRELPAWMCDAAVCAAIVAGPAQVSIAALIELRAVLTARAVDSAHLSPSDLLDGEEARSE